MIASGSRYNYNWYEKQCDKIAAVIGSLRNTQRRIECIYLRVRWRRERCWSIWVSRKRRSGAPAVPLWAVNQGACRDVSVPVGRPCPLPATTNDDRRNGNACRPPEWCPLELRSGRWRPCRWNSLAPSETCVWNTKHVVFMNIFIYSFYFTKHW